MLTRLLKSSSHSTVGVIGVAEVGVGGVVGVVGIDILISFSFLLFSFM